MIEFLSVIPNNVTKPIIAPTDKEPPRRIKIALQGNELALPVLLFTFEAQSKRIISYLTPE
jgi:hypothetical protein